MNNRTIPESILFTSIDDGDVFGNKYNLIENDGIEDFIGLTTIDPKTLEVMGSFQASFARDTSRPKFDLFSPDTIIFTNGVSHGRINR